MFVNRRYTAKGKNLPSSPKKVRPIADNIRGKPYTEAVAILCSMPNKGAKLLCKVIKSAASNAIYHNRNLSEDMIFVKTVMVDDGRRRRSIWPRARGRADRLINRSCHIFVEVYEKMYGGE
ncbi:50S ribosomal protein L22 [Borrelia miyamotoi]|uniref:Large ribosomal subunit protein uL22 n=1 Tax=Borrelia miyamotoi TaxID=47466 RepID=A0AAX3JMQ9_9SPIR|nr:50S ribosomal protein L22 [Borrelia miyamotoi]QFP41864.1 50S ribosomal protein L22 [Borrelia miyamotoi]QFP47984.1 50S ribosomal protein L22 [Borrelia miyamotoi]QGT56178.1 50S ribosomal protein L22 [Borrelia miyamotoi]QGT56523.1 50S ribosomal protein L22 [Borrelia miyamotoi]WAZ72225.1 50S ribosomal protein L22 [Borrelia miyamotoi]